MKSLSIVIPVFNSQDTIRLLVEKLTACLTDRAEFEIILINDCSRDKSYEACLELAAGDRRVKVINLSMNFGQHNAILTGLRYVSCDYVICMDDDLQNHPEDIFNLLEKIDEGYDVVYGKYDTMQQSIFRRVGSMINDYMGLVLLNKPGTVYMGSFFIMKSYIANEIARYEGPYAYLGGLILRVTRNIGSVAVKHYKRETGRSNYSFLKLLSLWVNGFTNFSVVPLRISTFGGFAVSFVGFICLMILIIRKFIYPGIPVGWTSIAAIILFLGGLQLVSIGLVGEYVGRMFLTINKKPNSVIKEKINLD